MTADQKQGPVLDYWYGGIRAGSKKRFIGRALRFWYTARNITSVYKSQAGDCGIPSRGSYEIFHRGFPDVAVGDGSSGPYGRGTTLAASADQAPFSVTVHSIACWTNSRALRR